MSNLINFCMWVWLINAAVFGVLLLLIGITISLVTLFGALKTIRSCFKTMFSSHKRY